MSNHSSIAEIGPDKTIPSGITLRMIPVGNLTNLVDTIHTKAFLDRVQDWMRDGETDFGLELCQETGIIVT